MKINWILIAITATFTLLLSLNTHTYAFHENLGIDDNKASELYQTNPNDPAIFRWKNALQSAITSMDKCFGYTQEVIACQFLISTITSNCKSHPNTLLACNDARLAQYPLILQQAKEEQKKTEEEQKNAEEEQKKEQRKAYLSNLQNVLPKYALSVFEKCFSNPNSNTTFEVASPSCDGELLLLLQDCNTANMTSSPFNYCKDERYVGYLKKNGIVNSTVSSYSNVTGNSSSSNSTYP